MSLRLGNYMPKCGNLGWEITQIETFVGFVGPFMQTLCHYMLIYSMALTPLQPKIISLPFIDYECKYANVEDEFFNSQLQYAQN